MSKVLIVEDDVHIQDIFKIMFSSYGYEIECLDSGEQMSQFSAQAKTPDLIILDKQLPGVNGLELCKRLKAESLTSHVPVIVISALSGIKDQAMRVGADAYIEKPFNMHVILKKVAELLSNRSKSIL